ncbi:DUF4307 domain-containing protein [Leucobacter sp. W1153]|uniref:DUF4307 domain-containing protein n=1 Tax=Leucobacter sp. W1153 TaxID=3439064 RepID=UPI003F37E8D0
MTQTADSSVPTQAPLATPGLIDERYGRRRQRGIDKRVGWILAGVALLTGLAVLLFGGWQDSSRVEFRDLAYSVESDREVSVSFEVTAPPRTELACALEALSPSFATVGWKVLELEPSPDRTRRFTDTLVTTSPATTGIVRSCWIREDNTAG